MTKLSKIFRKRLWIFIAVTFVAMPSLSFAQFSNYTWQWGGAANDERNEQNEIIPPLAAPQDSAPLSFYATEDEVTIDGGILPEVEVTANRPSGEDESALGIDEEPEDDEIHEDGAFDFSGLVGQFNSQGGEVSSQSAVDNSDYSSNESLAKGTYSLTSSRNTQDSSASNKGNDAGTSEAAQVEPPSANQNEPEQNNDKKDDSENDSGNHDPSYNNRMVIPRVMADHCKVSAEDMIKDNSKMHDCVRKYLMQIKSSNQEEFNQGNKDYRLMQYDLIIENIMEALKVSMAVTRYEEMQNKQSESRSKGSTNRDQEAGMANSKAFTINVANDILNTTADLLKYEALSQISLIDPKSFEEDTEAADDKTSAGGNDIAKGINAKISSGSATVEMTEPVAEVDGAATAHFSSPENMPEGACILGSNMLWIDNGTSLKVGENRYVTCKDGVLTMNNKTEDGQMNEGTQISPDAAKTLITSAPDEYKTGQTSEVADQLTGQANQDEEDDVMLDGGTLPEVVVTANKPSAEAGNNTSAENDNSGGSNDTPTDSGDKTPASSDESDSQSNDSSESSDDESEPDDDADNDTPEDSKSNQNNNNNNSDDGKTYTGIYNERQLYPNAMATYCQINGEDMAKDITQIENCLIRYIVSNEKEDATEKEVARNDFNTLRAAMLNMVLSQATTKEKNEQTLEKKLEDEYQKSADKSDDQQKDMVVISETGAFLTDIINAMRDMYADKMKYESIEGLQGIDFETVKTAQPEGTKLQMAIVEGNK